MLWDGEWSTSDHLLHHPWIYSLTGSVVPIAEKKKFMSTSEIHFLQWQQHIPIYRISGGLTHICLFSYFVRNSINFCNSQSIYKKKVWSSLFRHRGRTCRRKQMNREVFLLVNEVVVGSHHSDRLLTAALRTSLFLSSRQGDNPLITSDLYGYTCRERKIKLHCMCDYVCLTRWWGKMVSTPVHSKAAILTFYTESTKTNNAHCVNTTRLLLTAKERSTTICENFVLKNFQSCQRLRKLNTQSLLNTCNTYWECELNCRRLWKFFLARTCYTWIFLNAKISRILVFYILVVCANLFCMLKTATWDQICPMQCYSHGVVIFYFVPENLWQGRNFIRPKKWNN